MKKFMIKIGWLFLGWVWRLIQILVVAGTIKVARYFVEGEPLIGANMITDWVIAIAICDIWDVHEKVKLLTEYAKETTKCLRTVNDICQNLAKKVKP